MILCDPELYGPESDAGLRERVLAVASGEFTRRSIETLSGIDLDRSARAHGLRRMGVGLEHARGYP